MVTGTRQRERVNLKSLNIDISSKGNTTQYEDRKLKWERKK